MLQDRLCPVDCRVFGFGSKENLRVIQLNGLITMDAPCMRLKSKGSFQSRLCPSLAAPIVIIIRQSEFTGTAAATTFKVFAVKVITALE